MSYQRQPIVLYSPVPIVPPSSGGCAAPGSYSSLALPRTATPAERIAGIQKRETSSYTKGGIRFTESLTAAGEPFCKVVTFTVKPGEQVYVSTQAYQGGKLKSEWGKMHIEFGSETRQYLAAKVGNQVTIAFKREFDASHWMSIQAGTGVEKAPWIRGGAVLSVKPPVEAPTPEKKPFRPDDVMKIDRPLSPVKPVPEPSKPPVKPKASAKPEATLPPPTPETPPAVTPPVKETKSVPLPGAKTSPSGASEASALEAKIAAMEKQLKSMQTQIRRLARSEKNFHALADYFEPKNREERMILKGIANFMSGPSYHGSSWNTNLVGLGSGGGADAYNIRLEIRRGGPNDRLQFRFFSASSDCPFVFKDQWFDLDHKRWMNKQLEFSEKGSKKPPYRLSFEKLTEEAPRASKELKTLQAVLSKHKNVFQAIADAK